MIFEWLANNYTLIIVIMGMALLSITASVTGTILIHRKQALLGDALSHATLPGVVLSFMLTNTKTIWILLVGAAVSAIVSMLLLHTIKKYSKTKNDAAMALILSSFFGLGQLLLVYVQGNGHASQAGLSSFIFGQAATMLRLDVFIIAGISFVILLLIIIFWKEIKHFVFNAEHYKAMGFSVMFLEYMLTIMTVMIVVVGIRMIGVILMSALLIAPGVASRQWSNRLSVNAVLAAVFASVSSVIGSIISSNVTNLPTGPVVVLILSGIVLFSLFFSYRRGLIARQIKNMIYIRKYRKYKPLIHLLSGNPGSAYPLESWDVFAEEKMIRKVKGEILLTEKGKALALDILGKKR